MALDLENINRVGVRLEAVHSGQRLTAEEDGATRHKTGCITFTIFLLLF